MKLILALAFFAGIPASAETFCTPGEQIYDKAEMCEDNYLFVQAADQCVDRLTNEVKSATATLTRKFMRNDGKDQSLDFNTSLRDYDFSSTTLAALIAKNKQAIADVQNYYPHVIEPEDLDEVENADEWVKSVPCYYRTRKSIINVVGILEGKLKNLEYAKSIADANDNTSNHRESNVGVISESPAPVRATTAAGSGKRVPAGKSVNPRSDITGVHEEDKKEAEGARILGKQPKSK